jgi:glycosyltransferase involved in cell wall biosynthesis
MLKNEQRIKITFDSVKDYIGTFVIFDTGSTDDTVERVQTYCRENGITLHLKQGDFVNFCTSRNVMLDYAEERCPGQDKFFLLLDANDEMQEMPKLVDYIRSFKGTQSGFYLTQRWWSGHNLDSYYNVRMIRGGFNWRYKAVVHEYIMTPLLEVDKKPEAEVIFRLEGIYVYQDRTLDDDKSFKRFKRDKELLYAEYVRDPHEPRTLFYLAQTCGCLGLSDEAYKFYLLRIKEIGFYEEVYQSFYRLGELAQSLGHDWEEALMWYTKAYQHSQRAEPLVKIAEYYKDNNLNGEKKSEWHTAYMYANMACQLIFPVNQILFVDRRVYTYKRHSLMGIIGYYVGRYKEGKEACLKAIEAENQELDRNNLKFYIAKELELIQGGNLGCPALIAVSILDKEVRSKEEFELKHDRSKAARDIINTISAEQKAKSQPISSQILETLCRVNGIGVSASAVANPTPAQASNMVMQDVNPVNSVAPDMAAPILKGNRRDRRSKLREMVNLKRKEEVATKAKKR